MFRSDAPLPEVPRPLHRTPRAHQPFVDSHPDAAEFDDLLDDDFDGGAALAEDVMLEICPRGNNISLYSWLIKYTLNIHG